ncbi:hypothetical protein ATO6_20065 [Oceanicola sp. 22II-s10i]|uniref:YciI family protein n=1 Tax=Oceanicola sp. 22II-s10i TaxID=1317116 RepID=UPI000B51F368|nr:YciI family protein [Oceanicola sp. 22II-s10i]OWU83146.1 hypothetical protein ATO6_20065 [Oceanicola sp. 22II-s10i]
MDQNRTEAEVTAGLRSLELYAIETSPARSDRTRAVLPDHIRHQIELEQRGILFSAGPLFEEGSDIPVAGLIVIRAQDFEEARAIADSDPFHAQGIRSYTIRKWVVNEGSFQQTIRLSNQSVVFS